MATIRVVLEDHNGNLIERVKMSQEAAVARLIPALITTLKLPITDEAGSPIYYHLDYRNRHLQENETLGSAQVQEGDTLVILPEMIVGCLPLGTLIRMADGKQIPIESIKIDDEILSWDLEGQKPVSTFIIGIHQQQVSTLLLLNNQLKLSVSQPVWVNDSWKFANDISVGDQLLGLQRQEIASSSTGSVDEYSNDQQQGQGDANYAIALATIVSSLETIDGLFDVRHLWTLNGLPFFAEDILVQSYNATGLIENQPTVSKQAFNHPIDSLFLDRFPTLEKGVEISSESPFHIHIVDEPLTIQNLSAIFTSLNTLSIKCQLIAQGRFDNLIEYTQTHTDRFELGAYFVINDITHNSPFNFDVSINPESVAKAMQLAIDAVSLTGLRKKEQELVLQVREIDVKVKEQEAQTKADNDEVLHRRELQEIELERQKKLIEIEKQQLELEKQRFELHSMRINFALETAERMGDLLNPGIEGATKTMIVQTLLPDLLQLGTSRGLQLALPSDQKKSGS